MRASGTSGGVAATHRKAGEKSRAMTSRGRSAVISSEWFVGRAETVHLDRRMVAALVGTGMRSSPTPP
ncbi:MAG: hypothetical protein ACO3NL_08230, partial [Phycisphaerales bacterium]